MIIVSVKRGNRIRNVISTSDITFNCTGCYFDYYCSKYSTVCSEISYPSPGSRFKLLTIYNIIKLCQN